MSGFGREHYNNHWRDEVRPSMPGLLSMPMYGQQLQQHVTRFRSPDALCHRPRFSMRPPVTGHRHHLNQAETWHIQPETVPNLATGSAVTASNSKTLAQETLNAWLTKQGLQGSSKSSIGATSGGEGNGLLTLLDVKLMLHKVNVLRLKFAQLTDNPTARLTDNPMARLTDNATARLTDNPATRLTDYSTARLTDNPMARLTDNPAGRLTDNPTARLTDNPMARLTDNPAGRLTDNPTARLTDNPMARLTDNPADVDYSCQGQLVDIQNEIHNLLSVLEDPQTKEKVRCKLLRARKRKGRRERHKQRQWEESETTAKRNKEANMKIDKWFDAIQEQKRTEQMLKAADQSMSGVRQKINDVVRQTELILALGKLRSIRERNPSSDKSTSRESTEKFTRKTAELVKLLDGRLEIYRKEETALKVMLETEQEESMAKEARIEAARTQRRHEKEERQKELWLFGPREVPAEIKPFYEYYTQAETDFDSFIRIRREWDSYLVPENVSGSSRMPRGWVIPPEPSSAMWSLYLNTQNGDAAENQPIPETVDKDTNS